MAKKNIKNRYKSFVFTVLLLVVFASTTYLISHYLNQPKFVRYPEFGIDIPESFSIHGIDVSHHQDVIDWEDVQAMEIKNIKIGFTFIKATEGVNNVDDAFRRNWILAHKNNVVRGAYHFFLSNKNAKDQAENFIETVNLQEGDLPPVLDIETINGATVAEIQQRAKEWLNLIEQHYKIIPIIYTNVSFYNNYLGADFNKYPLWIAHYLEKDKPRIERDWIFWQHNEKGHVNGIDAFVDFNVFNGNWFDFKRILVKE